MLENRIDEFAVMCTNKGLSRKTIGSYEQALRMFQRFAEEHNLTDEKKIKEVHITAYIGYLKERGKYTVQVDSCSIASNHPGNRRDYGDELSDTTINNFLRNMNVFFNWMVSERMIKANPIKKTHFIKVVRKQVEYLDDAAFNKLIRSLDGFSFSEVRDKVIIELLLDTGMRIGECLQVKDRDVNLELGTIFLPAVNTKGKTDRYVYFGTKMARELKRWLQFRDRYRNTEYLFCTNQGKPIQISNFETNLRKYAARCKIGRVHPHQLRNNFAKRFIMNGGDIFTLSKILGHSSVTVTEQAYLDLTTEDLRKKYVEFSPLNQIKSYY